MKNQHNVAKFMNCKGKRMSETEYNVLRDEQNRRIEMAYSHGYTLVSIVLALIAGIFAFITPMYNILTGTESVVGKYGWLDGIMLIGMTIIMTVPIFIVTTSSIKFNDNIRQIINISAYIRIFYEAPALFAECKDNTDNESALFGWETLHCNLNLPKSKTISAEYFFTAIFDFGLTLFLFGTFISLSAVKTFTTYSLPDKILFVIFAISDLIYLLFLISICVNIKINTDTGKMFKMYATKYTETYLTFAAELQLITESEKIKIEQYLKEKQEIDSSIQNELYQTHKNSF